ncbi:hypothetical protein PSYPI_37888, partial [Pseudomonas syringae pv. pisi str. 1704B]
MNGEIPRLKQTGDARCTDNPAKAEQAVKPRHHGLAAGALDNYRLHVGRAVHSAHARA